MSLSKLIKEKKIFIINCIYLKNLKKKQVKFYKALYGLYSDFKYLKNETKIKDVLDFEFDSGNLQKSY